MHSWGSGLRVGLMGGTFDPIHLGHLLVAEEARQKFCLEKIIFIPTGIPPHKPSEHITPGIHRYYMTLLATNRLPYFYVSRFEIDRAVPSYSIDTLRYFRNLYGKDARLFFITGIDTLLDILTWKDYEFLPDLCEFICATRPDFSFKDLQAKVYRVFPRLEERVHYLDVPRVEISSTEIRRRREKGMSITFMVPREVERYILKQGLFCK